MIRRRDCGRSITFTQDFINTHHPIIRRINPNYCIIDNQGAGDCFFLALQQAASLYTMTTEERIPFEVKRLRSQVASTFSRESFDEKKSIVEEIEEDEIPRNSLFDVIRTRSYEQTKKFMKSRKYWADEYTIEFLSKRKYTLAGISKRLRFIIYDAGNLTFWIPRFFMITDDDNLINNEEFSRLPLQQRERLGRSNDWKQKQKEDFHYVILIAETDNHYGLIAEENPDQMKTVFNYEELPESLKRLVSTELVRNLGLIRPSQMPRNNVSNPSSGGQKKVANAKAKSTKVKRKPVANAKANSAKIPYEKLNKKDKEKVDTFIENFKIKDETELNVIYNNEPHIQRILTYYEKKQNKERKEKKGKKK